MYLTIIILLLLGGITMATLNHPRFGRNPRNERLERIKESPNYRNGESRNQSITPQMTAETSKTRAMLNFIFETRESNRPDLTIPALKTYLNSLS